MTEANHDNSQSNGQRRLDVEQCIYSTHHGVCSFVQGVTLSRQRSEHSQRGGQGQECRSKPPRQHPLMTKLKIFSERVIQEYDRALFPEVFPLPTDFTKT